MAYKTYRATIVRVIDDSPKVKRFFLQLENRKEFSFVAGQNSALSIPGLVNQEGNPIKRLYSIASHPTSEELEFCIAVYPAPSFSSSLASLAVNQSVIVEGPFGIFKLTTPVRDQTTFIAAGTGIAPLMCMLRTLQQHDKTFTLYFGFRTPEDFLYAKELQKLAAENAHFKLILSASAPNNSWTGQKGRITTIIQNTLANQQQDTYVCGPPEMVKDTIAILTAKGFSKEQIKKEQW